MSLIDKDIDKDMDSRTLVRLSKRLSRVLRHDPASIGIRLDAQGWVALTQLLSALAAHGHAMTRMQLDAVVAGNDKQRFAVRTGADGREYIRANQGHTVPVELALPEVAPPAVLWHGTSASVLSPIEAQGLCRGRRHHVHLSADVATALRVGRRRGGAVVVLAVDAAAMCADGYVFYRSANGVWLTDHVPPRYLRRSD